MECVAALYQWRLPGFLTQGVPVGPVLTGEVLTIDAPLQGPTHDGRIVNGVWGPHLCFTHINCLELVVVSLALIFFPL